MEIIKTTNNDLQGIKTWAKFSRDHSLFVMGNLDTWGLESYFKAYKIVNNKILLGCIFIFNNAHVSVLLDNPKRPGPEIIMLIKDFIDALPSYTDFTVTDLHGRYLKDLFPQQGITPLEFAKLDDIKNQSLSYRLPASYIIKPLAKEELFAYYHSKGQISEFGFYNDIQKAMDTFEKEHKIHSTLICKVGTTIVGGVTVDGISESTGVIVSVFTLPSYRHQGVATALLKETIKKWKNFERTLYLSYSSAEAGNVYKSVGFVPYATGYTYEVDKEKDGK
jgi:GNAT superfamily N-acetyltransferase